MHQLRAHHAPQIVRVAEEMDIILTEEDAHYLHHPKPGGHPYLRGPDYYEIEVLAVVRPDLVDRP